MTKSSRWRRNAVALLLGTGLGLAAATPAGAAWFQDRFGVWYWADEPVHYHIYRYPDPGSEAVTWEERAQVRRDWEDMAREWEARQSGYAYAPPAYVAPTYIAPVHPPPMYTYVPEPVYVPPPAYAYVPPPYTYIAPPAYAYVPPHATYTYSVPLGEWR